METISPPGKFITLQEAIRKPATERYDVIGVCVDHLPAAKSKGTDYTIKFTLQDPSWIAIGQDRGMTFRSFDKSIKRLPNIKDNGDIVIMRSVSTKDIHGLIGISYGGTAWSVLSGASVVDSTCPNGSDIQCLGSVKPSIPELQYAKAISQQVDPSTFRDLARATPLQVESIMIENGGTPPPRQGKQRCLNELTLSKANHGKFADGRPAFADLLGEVRRVYSGDYSKVELFVTDYTTNPQLYNYTSEAQGRDGDRFDYTGNHDTWPGPWGRMTIAVSCWDANAMFARDKVKEGSFVLLRNCHIKMDLNGALLEAKCHGDRDQGTKVNIVICHPHEATNDEKFKDLLRRKREYEKMAAQNGLRMKRKTSDDENKKRSFADSTDGGPGAHAEAGAEAPSKKISKSKRKKNKKQAKQQAAQAQAQAQATTADTDPGGTPSNQYVRCNNVEVPLSTVDSILDPETLKRTTPSGNSFALPFQNCRYRCKVRVVDHFPHDIVDFSVPRQSSQYDALSDHSGDENEDNDQDTLHLLAQSNPSSVEWEWRFVLIVEDATFRPLDANSTPKKQMPLLVTGKDADFLFNDDALDACDLRRKPQELAKLKEKLFVLWGDLHERKEEEESSSLATGMTGLAVKAQLKPFECLVKEYGVPVTDAETREGVDTRYQRMFRLWGTTIS